MPAHPPPADAPQRRSPTRVLKHPPRAILNAIMAVAVFALERRIRKALRPGAEPGIRPR